MNSIYDKAVNYAFNLSRQLGKDLVHDSFIIYQEKHNKSLFDESEKDVKAFIKKIYWKKYARQEMVVHGISEKLKMLVTDDDYIPNLKITFLTANDIEQQINTFIQNHPHSKIFLS